MKKRIEIIYNHDKINDYLNKLPEREVLFDIKIDNNNNITDIEIIQCNKEMISLGVIKTFIFHAYKNIEISIIKPEYLNICEKNLCFNVGEDMSIKIIYINLPLELALKVNYTIFENILGCYLVKIDGKVFKEKFNSIEEMEEELKEYKPKNDEIINKLHFESNKFYKRMDKKINKLQKSSSEINFL